MAYTPNREETVYDDPPNGEAIVKLIKNKKMQVKFLDTNKNEFAGKQYKVSEWPDGINPKQLPGNNWKIRLNNDGKGIFSISPYNGQFKVKVKKFVSKEGEPPAQRYMDKWKYPDYVFFVILEIVDGEKACIGMEIFLMVHYRFDEDEDGNVKYTKWNERSNTVQTDRFLRLSGAWDKGALEFEDNLCPAFQKRILKADKTFNVSMENGFVAYMSGNGSDEIDDDDPFWEEDAEEKPKKTKKKKSKKVKVEEDVPFDWKEDDE